MVWRQRAEQRCSVRAGQEIRARHSRRRNDKTSYTQLVSIFIMNVVVQLCACVCACVRAQRQQQWWRWLCDFGVLPEAAARSAKSFGSLPRLYIALPVWMKNFFRSRRFELLYMELCLLFSALVSKLFPPAGNAQ